MLAHRDQMSKLSGNLSVHGDFIRSKTGEMKKKLSETKEALQHFKNHEEHKDLTKLSMK